MNRLAIAFAMLALGLSVVAATPSPRATEVPDMTPTPAAAPIDLGANFDGVLGPIGERPTISWRAVPGVDHFQLTATLGAFRVNSADPICTPPTQQETRTISIDETLAGTVTAFVIPFPEIPHGEAWFVTMPQVRLVAFDEAGQVVGERLGGGLAEARCGRPQIPPAVLLPATGAGMVPDERGSRAPLLLASLLLVLGSALAGAGTRR